MKAFESVWKRLEAFGACKPAASNAFCSAHGKGWTGRAPRKYTPNSSTKPKDALPSPSEPSQVEFLPLLPSFSEPLGETLSIVLTRFPTSRVLCRVLPQLLAPYLVPSTSLGFSGAQVKARWCGGRGGHGGVSRGPLACRVLFHSYTRNALVGSIPPSRSTACLP